MWTALVGVGVGGGCSSVDTATGGAGGEGSSSTATSTSASSSSSSSGSGGSTSSATTSGGSSTTGGNTATCYPGAQCPQVAQSECISLVDNTDAAQFTLRMADLKLTAPLALNQGLAKTIVQSGVTMNLASCDLYGVGTFSWLLQFDTVTGLLKTGGAKPAADPTQGYSFVDETITQNGTPFKIAPITAPAALNNGAFAVAMGQSAIIPIYLDLKANSVILLPLHDVKFSGVVSANRSCIGKYNSAGLDPVSSCIADDTAPAFIGQDGKANSDGALEGYITLEEADKIIISQVGQSLCVLLSGDVGQFGDGGSPVIRCKRDAASKIIFQGDWCNVTNDASCKDSLRLGGAFSASGVKVN
jgi:hypothetical protein